MAHYHLPHIQHLPHISFRVHPHLSQGARDSLWLFAALAIMIVVAAGVQWLFSMM